VGDWITVWRTSVVVLKHTYRYANLAWVLPILANDSIADAANDADDNAANWFKPCRRKNQGGQ
jgi:hypothetical protein